MKRIGILSDTHGKLREEAAEILKECDVILHAGDINTPKVLDSLREIAPLYVVRGNADKEWAEGLPEKWSEEICGIKIFMVHNKKHIPKETGNYDLVVFGHSHKYEEHWEGNCLFLNPGSCGPRRFSQPVTMAVVEVEAETGTIRAVRKDIVQSTGKGSFEQEKETGECEMAQKAFSTDKLRLILKDIDKGRTVSEIAAKYGMTDKMAEQICRLYLTHPGIDAVGVREKMGMPRDR